LSFCKQASASGFLVAIISALLFLSVLVLPAVSMAKQKGESISGRVETGTTGAGDREPPALIPEIAGYFKKALVVLYPEALRNGISYH